MSTTGRIEVNHLRKRVVVYGAVTVGQLARAIDVAEAEYGSKVMRYWIEWADAKRPKVRIRNYHIETGQSFQPPDVDGE